MLHPHLWSDDHSAARCTACEAVFSLFRCRRHHCRHCGNVFCDACTEKRLWLRPVPTPSSFPHMETSSTRRSAAEILSTPDVIRPTPAPASSLLNCALVLDGATSTISCTSKIEAQQSPANSRSTGDDDADRTQFVCLSSAGSSYEVPLLRQLSQTSQQTPTTETQLWKLELPATKRDDVSAHVRAGKEDCPGNCERSSSNNTRCMTMGTLYERRSNSERFNALCVEAEVPVRPPGSFQRSEGNALIESSSSRFGCMKSCGTAAVPLQTSRTPSQGNSHTRELQNVHQSRRVSSSLYSASINAISSTATVDVSSQAWATPEFMVGFEQGSSSHPALGSSATLGGGASVCASTVCESLLNHRGLLEHHNDQHQQGVTAGDCSALNYSLGTLRGRRMTSIETVSTASRGSRANSDGIASGNTIDNDDTYRRESYKVEMDSAQRITWYLCRVCHTCYDHLVESILHAHEGPCPATTLHNNSKLPLGQYARLCSPSELLGTDGIERVHRQRRDCEAQPCATSNPSATSLYPTAAASSKPFPLWSSIWSRVGALVSLPVSRTLSTKVFPAMTETSTPSAASLSPLKTRDDCQARRIAGRQVSQRANSSLATAQASTELGGSGCYRHPPNLESASGEDTMPSLPAQFDIKSPNIASTQPQQSSSSRRPRRTATPPRRLLISIDGSPGPLRQAVALARRRRRIAVILIDERDIASADNGNEVQQQQEAPQGTLSAHSPADVDEAAFRSCSVTDESISMHNPGQTSSITAAAGITFPVLQHAESETCGGQQPSQVTDNSPEPAVTTQQSAWRPKLSILVDDVTLGDAEGMAVVCSSGGSADAAALRGHTPAAWLLPQLPLQAAAPVSPFMVARASPPALPPFLLHENASLVTTVSSPVGTAATTSSSVTSKPISCLPDGPQVATSFPGHSESVPATSLTGGKLPALPMTLGSGVCVLRALFCQLRAVVHLSSMPAMTASTTPMPTSAAASGGSGLSLGARTTGASIFFADSAISANSQAMPMPLCGTGPESYAAQRQALVREMIVRCQLGIGAVPPGVPTSSRTASFTGGAYNMAMDQHEGAHWCGAAGQRGVPLGLGSSDGSYVNAAYRRIGGCPAKASFERTLASVTTYFQVRPPVTATAAAPATTAVTILPVSTQVELVGIPIDTAAVSGATALAASSAAASSGVSMASPGFTSPYVRGSGIGACPAIIPGLTAGDTTGSTSRPFTMTEFLPQLAKLSTNLDGYVIVILRRQSSKCACGGNRTSRGGGGTAAHPSSNCDSSVDAPVAQMCSNNSIGGQQPRELEDSTPHGSDEDQLASSACVSLSLLEESKSSVPRLLQLRDPNQRQRRCHRVTELFGGQHIRLLYQQLQSCGVTQPAISIVEVSNEAELGLPKPLPVYVASGKSPQGEGNLSHGELGTPPMPHIKARVATGKEDGVPEEWLGATKTSPQTSALSISGTSKASSVDSGLIGRSPSVLLSATAQPPQVPEKTRHVPSMHGDCFERPLLSAPVGIALGQAAKLPSTSAFPMAGLTALEQAMASVRYVSRQLGVSMCSMPYASESAPRTTGSASASYSSQSPAVPTATMVSGAPEPAVASSPTLKANNNGNGSGESALLTRALESLVATLVYRDICATVSQ